jgi:hypothetical protein
MGYYSTARGGFQIDPPITFSELVAAGYELSGAVKDRQWLELKDGWGELFFVLDVDELQTEDGVLTVIKTDRIETTDESQKMYAINDSVVTLVKDFGAKHQFDGKVVTYGEEDADVNRIRIVQNEVFNERPQLLWPDGSVESL